MSYQSFAHLLGLGRKARGAKAAADDPIVDDYQNDDPTNEQYADDDEDDAKARKARKARKATRADDDDDTDPDAEDDRPDADDDEDDAKARKARKARKATRADDDDDTDPDAEDEDDDDKSPKAIRRGAVKAERERCARIIAHGIKTGNVEQAAALAFDSDLSPKAAAGVIGLAKASQPTQTLASRMQGVDVPNAGMGDAENTGGLSKMAASIIAAAADAHGQ